MEAAVQFTVVQRKTSDPHYLLNYQLVYIIIAERIHRCGWSRCSAQCRSAKHIALLKITYSLVEKNVILEL